MAKSKPQSKAASQTKALSPAADRLSAKSAAQKKSTDPKKPLDAALTAKARSAQVKAVDQSQDKTGGKANEKANGKTNGKVAGSGGPQLEVPGSVKSPLRIFQIYYESWQRDLLDPSFAALDNSGLKSELEEFLVLERLAKSEHVKGAKLWGALSWRFTERTGMKSTDWVAAIQADRGKDVYFCDPAPVNEALYHNLWLQGEIAHPHFLEVCIAFFKATKLPLETLSAIVPGEQYATANYFVGTPRFWELYLPWVTELFKVANKNMPPKERDLMHAKAAEGPHKGMSLMPFILERLFPIFMKTAGKDLSYKKIALPALDAQLNVHLRLLREAKNLAHSSKSAWLAALWVNYRNLYFIQTNGKDWCAKNLRRITPLDIKFS
jgi:hypothetical protein